MGRHNESEWVQADFNGLFGPELLCLSHSDAATNMAGKSISLRTGMVLTAYDDDTDEAGNPDRLIASGVVEPSPPWLQCNGSRWVLRINEGGVFHESDLARSRGPSGESSEPNE